MSLSLALIAKDQVELVANIINNYTQYFSEIVIAGDFRHEEFEQLAGVRQTKNGECNVKYFQYKWCDDFADKRNFVASKVTNDYYVRIDTDDEIINAHNLNALADKARKMEVDVVYLRYIYATDKDGNILAEHWRESIIKKREGMYWKKKVHENIFWDDSDTANTVKDSSVVIKHNMEDGHTEKANDRNLRILVKEYMEDKENCDPRTIAYIGRSLLGMGHTEQAIPFLIELTQKSGWDDDKFFAYCQLSDAYLRLKKYEEALDSALIGLKIKPEFPDAYLKLGNVYLEKGDYKTALEWYEIGVQKPYPDTMIVLDPSVYGYIAQLNIAMCYLGLGNTEKALQFWTIAKKTAPNAEPVNSSEELFKDAYETNQFFYHLFSLSKMLEKMDKSRAKLTPNLIPEKYEIDSRTSAFRNRYSEPKIWEKNSIVFFCGWAYENWCDKSIETGIGGSEEAVINMSRELTKLGYKVTVYNQCGELAGNYNGVEYKNWTDFRSKDKFDTIIFWRGVNALVSAKNRIVWLHDVPFNTFNKHNADWYDKVFVLSEYHKSLLPSCVDKSKVVVTRNGIQLDHIPAKVDRIKNRLIYTSSYDRGLEELLDVFPSIKKEVPDATLHIFYGWNTYDKMVEIGMRDASFKDMMTKKMAQEGVFEHGRIGQKELVDELSRSDVFAYPCKYEEISCISVLRAQACGAVPVTTDYAALNESNKYGIKSSGKDIIRWKDALVNALKSDLSQKRTTMCDNYKEFGWDRVAKEWVEIFNAEYKNSYKSLDDYNKVYNTCKFIPSYSNVGEVPFLPRFEYALDKVAEVGNTCLDVGINDGGFALVATAMGYPTDGVDCSKEAVEFATKKAKDAGIKSNFYCSLIEEFKSEKTYDVVTALEVIEHVIDPRGFAEKLLQLAHKRVIISTPHKLGYFGENNRDPYHIHCFDENSIAEVLKGMNIVTNERIGDYLYVVIDR